MSTLWWNRGRLPEDRVPWYKLSPEGRVRASAPYWTHNMMVGVAEVVVRMVLETGEPLVQELALRAVEWIEHQREGCYND